MLLICARLNLSNNMKMTSLRLVKEKELMMLGLSTSRSAKNICRGYAMDLVTDKVNVAGANNRSWLSVSLANQCVVTKTLKTNVVAR